MARSATYNQPPANEKDRLIVKGIYTFIGMPNMDPSKGLRFPNTPAVKLQDSRGGIVLAGCSVAIVVVVIVTGLRILSRLTVKRSHLSWDDFWIVWAAVRRTLRDHCRRD